MKPALLWAVERIDAEGEPDPSGEFLKIGLLENGARRSIWLDLLDAEAFADGIQALARGAVRAGLPDGICEGCARAIAQGAPAYQSTPAGKRCLMCQHCAPTTGEEVDGINSAIRAGRQPEGFVSRADAIAWRARVRLAYDMGAKRLAPLPAAMFATSIEFPDPPATATIKTEEGENNESE